MPLLRLLNDVDHWRKRAEEMRKLAKIATKEDVKASLLKIANEYELLAKRAKNRDA